MVPFEPVKCGLEIFLSIRILKQGLRQNLTLHFIQAFVAFLFLRDSQGLLNAFPCQLTNPLHQLFILLNDRYEPLGLSDFPLDLFLKIQQRLDRLMSQKQCLQDLVIRDMRRSSLSWRSEEHTSELQSLAYLVCRLLLEKKKKKIYRS